MNSPVNTGATFTLPKTSLTLNRLGYGAMQLCGSHAWGPPKDVDLAVRLLREAVALGINHIDTADYYGPHKVNEIIKTALYPYPRDLVIATKVGFKRTPDRGWAPALSKEGLTRAVHDNLKNLGLDALPVVNLRVGGPMGAAEGSIEAPLSVLVDLKNRGYIRQIGISNVTKAQIEQACAMVDVVCVQNQYNLAHKFDDTLIDELAKSGIAYTPFFPLGGFKPVQPPRLEAIAAEIGKTPRQITLAWLLQRSPNMLLIPGTSSIVHLRENVEAANITLPATVTRLLSGL